MTINVYEFLIKSTSKEVEEKFRMLGFSVKAFRTDDGYHRILKYGELGVVEIIPEGGVIYAQEKEFAMLDKMHGMAIGVLEEAMGE